MAECWSCGAERGDACFCTTCGKIQPVGENRPDYFTALGLEPRMALAIPDLETAFRTASKTAHPDRYGDASSVERKLALRLTERINQGYRALKDPRTRAEYLMGLRGIEVGQETARTKDPMFLMEMMELGESIDALEDEDALEARDKSLKTRYDGLLDAVRGFLDDGVGEAEAAVAALDELRYLRRLRERVESKLEELY